MKNEVSQPPQGLSRAARWPLIFLTFFLISQVLLPSVLLFWPRPVRFGWQMYAERRELPTFTLVLRTGGTRLLSYDAVIVNGRTDMRIPASAVARLCAAYPEARGIRYTQLDEPAEEVVCP